MATSFVERNYLIVANQVGGSGSQRVLAGTWEQQGYEVPWNRLSPALPFHNFSPHEQALILKQASTLAAAGRALLSVVPACMPQPLRAMMRVSVRQTTDMRPLQISLRSSISLASGDMLSIDLIIPSVKLPRDRLSNNGRRVKAFSKEKAASPTNSHATVLGGLTSSTRRLASIEPRGPPRSQLKADALGLHFQIVSLFVESLHHDRHNNLPLLKIKRRIPLHSAHSHVVFSICLYVAVLLFSTCPLRRFVRLCRTALQPPHGGADTQVCSPPSFAQIEILKNSQYRQSRRGCGDVEGL